MNSVNLVYRDPNYRLNEQCLHSLNIAFMEYVVLCSEVRVIGTCDFHITKN